MIRYNEKDGLFFLESDTVSYIMCVENDKLHHLYFGQKISREDIRELRVRRMRSFSPYPIEKDDTYSLDILLNEYPEFNGGDYRTAAIVASGASFCATEFKYKGYSILKNKPKISGMPCTRSGETLVITLFDRVSGLKLNLSYTIFDEGGIARSAEIINESNKVVEITRFMSGGLELDDGNYDVLTLNGRHEFEREMQKRPLVKGITSVSSVRGTSSHQSNPFMALLAKDSSEDSGEAFGFSLVYSGNFLIEAEVDQIENVRVLVGLNPITTRITLEPKQKFCSPEAVIMYSNMGLGGLSRAFHDLVRNQIVDPKFAKSPRPILINNWESTYFDFDEEKICDIIRSVKGTGIEMMVLDDGWFGKRNSDTTSLGDWVVNRDKLKNGLSVIIEECKKNKLKFGLWFEPEMVSIESELFKSHPDYAIDTLRMGTVLSRSQLVLNFSKKEVVDCIFEKIRSVLTEYPYISYIKWDMNRNLTCVPKLSNFHDYVLGVYSLYERILYEFPNVLIEGCSGGGGRFDLGILYYSPQIWTSDNTDAFSRSIIQYGTSICYPPSVMSNHVSMTPNHQTGRSIPFNTRGIIASLGLFGYELNPLELNDKEKKEIFSQIASYKKVSELVLTGDFYRIKNPLADNAFSAMLVDKNKTSAYVVYMKCLEYGKNRDCIIKLKGLNSEKRYTLSLNNKTYSGAALMNVGVQIHTDGDFSAVSFFATEKK